MIEKSFTAEKMAQISRAFDILVEDLRVWFASVGKLMGEMFPIISEGHRAEVRAVRTAYRRKKKGRW